MNIWDIILYLYINIVNLNRYKWGLETCQQAKTSKSGHTILFFSTRPSDECNSALSRKYSRPLLDVFAFIG